MVATMLRWISEVPAAMAALMEERHIRSMCPRRGTLGCFGSRWKRCCMMMGE